MPWTTPKTWADNELVSAALMNQQLRDNMNVLIEAVAPTGALVPYAGSSAPTGWLLCDGLAVSRTTYGALYTILGTTYGAGDGSTTFNVPDLRGRFPLGKDNMGGTSAGRVTATQADNLGQGSGGESHTLAIGEIPAHQHAVYFGAGGGPIGGANVGSGASAGSYNSASAGAGGAHNNMPPYITLNYLIKT